MTISEIIKQVVENHTAIMVMPLKHENGQPIQYDTCKYGERHRGRYSLLDATTANAMWLVYQAMGDEAKAKFDTVPLMTLVDFCWKHVK